MKLTKEECQAIHAKNAGKLTWVEMLCVNDGRLVLRNESETLHVFMSAEYDQDEQAQCARLCAALNGGRKPAPSEFYAKALDAITRNQDEKEGNEGLCPFGCDAPWIALSALGKWSDPKVEAWKP